MRKLAYSIVFVSDMKRSVEFYRDVLGLPLKFESPFWTEFATEGATLALHPADAGNPQPAPADRHPAGSCRIGLHVDNLDAFHQTMLAKGVRCIQPPQVQFGAKLALYVDPDGLGISVGEGKSS